eukprot:jgi/Ulvmu1/8755/UM048_0009.1
MTALHTLPTVRGAWLVSGNTLASAQPRGRSALAASWIGCIMGWTAACSHSSKRLVRKYCRSKVGRHPASRTLNNAHGKLLPTADPRRSCWQPCRVVGYTSVDHLQALPLTLLTRRGPCGTSKQPCCCIACFRLQLPPVLSRMAADTLCTLPGLPEDERRHVCALLEPADVLSLGQVCRSLRRAGADEVVWEQFCRDRWFKPHSCPQQTWKDTYCSDNGWNRYTFSSNVIAPSRLSVGARWGFEWHSESRTGVIAQWSERRVHVHASSHPHDPQSWAPCGSFSGTPGRLIRSCCALSPTRFVAADNAAVMTIHSLPAAAGGGDGVAAGGGGGAAAPGDDDDTQQAGVDADGEWGVGASGSKRLRDASATPDAAPDAAPVATVSMSADHALEEASSLLAADPGTIWGLARSRSNSHQGWVVSADLHAGRATCCRDFMEDYKFFGLCQHPADQQVAVVVGAHSGGACGTCLAADNPARPWSPVALCEHRNFDATLTLIDMRAPRAADRCMLQRPSVFHRVTTSPRREHFVFTSHQRTPACAWDLRNMSYPVYQGRLDHAAAPLPHTGLAQAVWHTNSKALFLSCHDDYMLGQADNGMLWYFDLSAMLGWAATARGCLRSFESLGADPCGPDRRGGCWLQHRSCSDAEPGQWTHPQPLGIVPGDISAAQAVFALPDSPTGAFITAGFCSAATAGAVDGAPCVLPPPAQERAVRPGHGHGLLLFHLSRGSPAAVHSMPGVA